MGIGKILKYLRTATDTSQAKLARELGVTPGALLRLAIPVSMAAIATVLLAGAIEAPNPWSWTSLTLRAAAVCATFVVAHEVFTRGAMLSEIRVIMNSRSVAWRQS